eukprot:11373340-Alexandrium_andersonii.AAC.1
MQLIAPGDNEWVDEAVHGAKLPALESILREGMNTAYSKGPTARCHHHMARQIRPGQGDQEGVRHGSDIAVFVNLRALHEAGAPIYLSYNGVYLTAGFRGRIPV